MFLQESQRMPRWALAVASALILAFPALTKAKEPVPPPWEAIELLGVRGGLCVQLGADDVRTPYELARTGRFLVQVLEADDAKAAEARETLEKWGLYGLVSVDRLQSAASLPYADNIVNLVIIGSRREAISDSLAAEIARVLRPGGMLLGSGADSVLKAGGLKDAKPVSVNKIGAGAFKPRPAAMDDWPQPRHAADGNPVSADTLAGPPRGVRWVAGPFREIGRMISSGGRSYYGDLWARDAFNGLLLWQYKHDPAQEGNPGYQYKPGGPPPIAVGDLVFALVEGQVLAIDGPSGGGVRRYPAAGNPKELLASAGLLLAVDDKAVRALDIDSAELRWEYPSSQPKSVVAGERSVCLLEGSPQRGEKVAAVCLDLADGKVRWRKDDEAWVPLVRRIVSHGDLVAMEVSTYKDEGEGNVLHMLSADDGRQLWQRAYTPGMNHVKQARAMFVGDSLWVLENRKGVRLDPLSGEELGSCPAGFCHCFPPVATTRFLLAGEMELTDLASGSMDANRITKAACSRDFGWIPANGLIYVTPKHCVCWPMLRGFVAMSPNLPAGVDAGREPQPGDFPLERGPAAEKLSPLNPQPSTSSDWPMYRRDAWRSSATPAEVPADLTVAWTVDLGDWPAKEGPILEDWRENPFVDGPVTPPVVAGGTVYVARPDAHQVVALDAASGRPRWQFTASGRVDTAPTVYNGLCLFGSKSGWVYCLRASDGEVVWQRRVAPVERRIVAYGQIESPWPVPGSVLVDEGVAYFAAGRQPLADGGILVFAAEPETGRLHWVRRLDTVPTENFYGCSGLEFDNFDLMQREGDRVSMSRWLFDRATGEMSCKATEAFVRLSPGGQAGVVVPRQCWTYAPRHQPRVGKDRPAERPLVVFRDGTLIGCLQDQRNVYRRDFSEDEVEKFDVNWITGWAASQHARERSGEVWRSDRLAQNTTWSSPVFDDSEAGQRVAAMVLAGDTLFLGGIDGGLTAMSASDGRILSRSDLPPVVWDGIAAAGGRLFVSTKGGDVICLAGR